MCGQESCSGGEEARDREITVILHAVTASGIIRIRLQGGSGYSAVLFATLIDVVASFHAQTLNAAHSQTHAAGGGRMPVLGVAATRRIFTRYV